MRRFLVGLVALALAGLTGCYADARPVDHLLPTSAPAVVQRGSVFAGKFELVPLFDAGHRPVLKNGHQAYAARNAISFITEAGDVVTVHAGQTTDLASIPRALWGILPPDGAWAEAAVFHDSCFRTRGSFTWHGHLGRTRAAPYDFHGCNEILREAMVSLQVPAWKRIAIFEAVEMFGGSAFGT